MFLGESITIRNSYRNAWKHVWRFLGLYILQGLVIVAAPVAVFCAGFVVMVIGKISGYAAGDNSPLFGGLLFLLFLLLGAFALWMLLRLCLAFPVCVVEQLTAWAALKRGIRLSHGTRGRIFVLYLMGMVLNWVLTWPVTFVVIVVVTLVPSLQGQKHAQLVGMLVVFTLYGSYFAVKALIKPIYGIALTIFYFDQRIRKEGFDIEWMMHQAGMVEAGTGAPAPAPASEVQVPALPPQPADEVEPVVAVPLEPQPPQTFPVQDQDLSGTPGEAKA